jgi:hypothetical protein
LAHRTAALVEHYEILKANLAMTIDLKKGKKVYLQST